MDSTTGILLGVFVAVAGVAIYYMCSIAKTYTGTQEARDKTLVTAGSVVLMTLLEFSEKATHKDSWIIQMLLSFADKKIDKDTCLNKVMEFAEKNVKGDNLQILLDYADKNISKDSWVAKAVMSAACPFQTGGEVENAVQCGKYLKIAFTFEGKKYYVYDKYNGTEFRKGGKVYAVINGERVDLQLCPGLKLRLKDGALESTKIEAEGAEDPDFDDLYS